VKSSIHPRGKTFYKIKSSGHSFDLYVWCGCVRAEHEYHWHLLSQHRTFEFAVAAIDVKEAARRLVAP